MIKLRDFRACDFDYMIGWLSDEKTFYQWCGSDFSYPLDLSQLAEYKHSVDISPTDFAFTAVDESEKPVGHIGLKIFDQEKGCCMLRYVLIGEESMRGKGLGSEMVRLALEFAFYRLKMNIVALKVLSRNTGAIRCYKKLGFEMAKFSAGKHRPDKKESDRYDRHESIIMYISRNKMQDDAVKMKDSIKSTKRWLPS